MCGLACSAFARHYLRNHCCFLFLWVLRCFTSPRSLLLPYVFRQRSPDITPVSFEVSLFGDPRIEARLPAPRGLSQVTTSFIGSWCLGIHRLPLVACCYYKDARVHCEVLNIRAGARAAGAQPTGSGPHEEGSGQRRPKPQDPTACRGRGDTPERFHSCEQVVLARERRPGLMVNVPHLVPARPSAIVSTPISCHSPPSWAAYASTRSPRLESHSQRGVLPGPPAVWSDEASASRRL
jgi:hypothetical protein